MKKYIFAVASSCFILFSCDNASGGNKNILPVDPSTQAETPQTDPHAGHTQSVADTTKTAIKDTIAPSINSTGSGKSEAETDTHK